MYKQLLTHVFVWKRKENINLLPAAINHTFRLIYYQWVILHTLSCHLFGLSFTPLAKCDNIWAKQIKNMKSRDENIKLSMSKFSGM